MLINDELTKKVTKAKRKSTERSIFPKKSRNLSQKKSALLGEFTIGGFYYIKNVGHPKIVH